MGGWGGWEGEGWEEGRWKVGDGRGGRWDGGRWEVGGGCPGTHRTKGDTQVLIVVKICGGLLTYKSFVDIRLIVVKINIRIERVGEDRGFSVLS